MANFEEESRKRFAREKGLPETATWTDINHYSSEESHKRFAREKGLPETATWTDINQAKRK